MLKTEIHDLYKTDRDLRIKVLQLKRLLPLNFQYLRCLLIARTRKRNALSRMKPAASL